MKKWTWVFLIALGAELFAIRWRWEAAPTDQLRVWYDGSFRRFLVETITPWLIAFGVLLVVWLLISKVFSKSAPKI